MPRPLLSVMIPTFNCTGYLRQTLASVLAQDPGPEKMQIEVIDDGSTDDPRAVVEEVGRGRVRFFQHPRNLGLVGNMNACVARARGEWIHLLHGDDYVLDGFYAEVQALARRTPTPRVIAIRCHYVNANDVMHGESPDFSAPDGRERLRAEFLRGTPVQFAGMVVHREAYARWGGFRSDFSHVTDLEMWSRLLFQDVTAFSSQCLCAYRLHAANASSKLVQSGGNIRERHAVLPWLSCHAGLSPDEELCYRREVQFAAYVQCLRFTHSRETRSLCNNLRAYAGCATTLAETALFVRRMAGMLLRHICFLIAER